MEKKSPKLRAPTLAENIVNFGPQTTEISL